MESAGHYTSFNPVDDRFGFSRKGVFRCRYKLQSIYLLLYSAGIALILFVLFMIKMPDNSLSDMVVSLAKLAALIVSPFFLVSGIRIILSGAYYSYTANEEKMLIVCPRENHRSDIFYNTVKSVNYEDIMMFGKKRGYKVTIVTTDNTYVYQFIFPQNKKSMGKDLTPFRIIEERSGYISRPEFVAGKRIDQ